MLGMGMEFMLRLMALSLKGSGFVMSNMEMEDLLIKMERQLWALGRTTD